MVLLAEWVRSIPKLGAAHMSVFGVLLILIIIFLPNGLVGDFGKIRRLFARKGAAA
jgi:branched-chain amino acid transport system permease protein